LRRLEQLAAAADWRGVVELESASREVVVDVGKAKPDHAAFVYCILGVAYQSLGGFSKAIEYQTHCLAIAKKAGDRVGEGKACGNIGNAYQSLGDVGKAIDYHTQDLAIAKELEDRVGKSRAYGNLGIAYQSLGEVGKAIEYHTQDLALAKEVGNRTREGAAYSNLGASYQSLGDFSEAIAYHTQHLAIAQEVGDRAGEGRAYGNLGCAYRSQGDSDKAIEYQMQCLAIVKEVGDLLGEGRAYAGLGNAYQSVGKFDIAIQYHTQHLAIVKEVEDRAGESKAYGNLGACQCQIGEYVKAFDYHETQHALATELGLAHVRTEAALCMGLALRLEVRANRRGPAASADGAPEPHSHSSASACLNDKVREAENWLQAALQGGYSFARLHLAHLTFDAGQEDTALVYLKEHLSWCVEKGRDWCDGCQQLRGHLPAAVCARLTDSTPMLTCSGCRVAKFCSADHQKMASKKAALGGNQVTGRHKDICGVLGKWRQIVKDGVSPDSCTADLLAFLRR
jgi:tetratricopeptide (TPR) repeat protein